MTTHWKTTVQGFITSAVAIGLVLQGLGIKTWAECFTLPRVLAIVAGASPAIIGLLQNDAGKQDALTPDGKKVTVPSHEIPDNPADVPDVTK